MKYCYSVRKKVAKKHYMTVDSHGVYEAVGLDRTTVALLRYIIIKLSILAIFATKMCVEQSIEQGNLWMESKVYNTNAIEETERSRTVKMIAKNTKQQQVTTKQTRGSNRWKRK
jgi:hypothetical protein